MRSSDVLLLLGGGFAGELLDADYPSAIAEPPDLSWFDMPLIAASPAQSSIGSTSVGSS
jgi:hypothetical protein